MKISELRKVQGPTRELNERYMVDLKVKFDPETGATVPDESDLIDLEALIQTYKDQCGMELAQKLIKTGQAQPEDFKDDGKRSGEVPTELETAQGRANAALAATAHAEALAKGLDLPKDAAKLTDDQLTAIIAKTIQEKYPDIIKKEEVKADE